MGAALLAGTPVMHADTLVLKNGERLKGAVVRVEGTQVVFKSQVLGEVRLPRSQVSVWPESFVLGAAESVALESQQPSAEVTAPAPAPAAPAPTQPAPEQEPAAVPSKPWWSRIGAPGWWVWWTEHRPLREWKTSLNLGYKLTEARDDRTDLNLRFETTRRTERGEYRVTGRYDFADITNANGNTYTATDRMQAGVRLRRDLSSRYFVQANSRYLADAVARIDRELEQSIGLGWRLLDSPKLRATVTPSATIQNQELAGQLSRWEYHAKVFQDFRFRINDRFTFYEEADFSMSPENQRDYQASFNARLEAKLTTTVAADMRYELELDNTITSTTERTQSRVLFTLGLRF